jgi:hypothetical protein
MSDEMNNNQTGESPQVQTGAEQGPQPSYTQAPPNHTPQPGYGQQPQGGSNGKGIASLILGIVSIPLAPFTLGIGGLICGIIAIVLGVLSRKQQRNGLAIGGLVTGIIGLVISAILIIGIAVAATYMTGAGADMLQQALEEAQ